MGRKNAKSKKHGGSEAAVQSEVPSSLEAVGPEPEKEPTNGNGNGNGGYVTGDEADSYVRVNGKKRKIFRARESILTELTTKDKNMEALYHACMVMAVTAIAYSLLKDMLEAGGPSVDIYYYYMGFGSMRVQVLTILVWIPLQLASFAVYPTFKVWQWLLPRGGLPVNVLFILIAILYNIIANAIVIASITHFDLPPVGSVVLSIEQLRITMKSYSFIRENAYKVLRPWSKDDESGPVVWYGGQMDPRVGSFSQYLYFLFAPTLLYRDHYPRTPRVRKLRVLAHLFKCAISVTFVTILVKEIFDSYHKSEMVLAHTFLVCLLWGLVLQFMAGYFFLHSWSNLFGELLRFADREFYSDWWTCTSYSSFYRKWNLLVHDWIKAYIYQDLKDVFNSKIYNRFASLPAIFISAIYHEYVLWAPVRFVLPVLLVNFGTFGVLLYFFRPFPHSKFGNYMIHIGLNLGVGIMVFCYSTEFYARKVCVKEENFINTFIPRSYECFM